MYKTRIINGRSVPVWYNNCLRTGKMNTGNIITIKLERPAYGGLAIGKWQGKVVMVRGALPGELVEAAIEEEKKDFLTASATRILEPSSDRITPECAHSGTCGGCQLHYISYERQVALKGQVLLDSIRRLAKIEIDLAPPLIHDEPWHYRYRGQFKADLGKIGFYRGKTREVIDIPECPLMAEEINGGLGVVRSILQNDAAEHSLFGYVRELHISAGEGLTALIKSRMKKTKKERSAQAALFLHAGFSGVCIEESEGRVTKYGRPYITLNLQGLRYTVSPLSFFQSHWTLNTKVVSFVKEALLPFAGATIVDLYAGAGNFSLPFSGEAQKIIAVEENLFAVEDGIRNLGLNAITNCRFIKSSAEQVEIKETVQILILDPPRLGLSNRTMEKVFAMLPERIVYISCNPATFARDLKKLSPSYELESLRMIDFFPQTYHIESLAFLRRR
jgi:23S rRNA (uracil1939-C5)-methyltransferase